MNGHHNEQLASRRGLSAIELLVVLTVFAVIIAFAMPHGAKWRQAMVRQGLVDSIEEGDREGMLYYLKKGASPDAWSGSTPHFCLRCQVVIQDDREMAALVFPLTPSGDREVPSHSPPLLNLAVALNNAEMTVLLLDGPSDPNRRARYGFHRYKSSGSPGNAMVAIRTLLQAYAEVGEPIRDTALKVGLVPFVVPEHLIANATDANAEEHSANTRANMFMNTLLHDAVILDGAPILSFLLKRGVSPDLTDQNGETALHLANRLGRANLSEILIAAGACGDCPDNAGETPEDERAKWESRKALEATPAGRE